MLQSELMETRLGALANNFIKKYGAKAERQRLANTEQRFRAALGNIQRQFAGVTKTTERRPLNGKSAEALTITPDQLLSTLGGIKWRQEASKGDPQRNLAGVDADGAIWSVDIHPSGSVVVAKFRVVEGDGKKLEENQSIH